MHGAAHWVAFNMWHVGGTVVVQNQTRHLDPHDIWSTVEREKVNAITIVGDAFGRPLADQLRKRRYDLSSLKLFTSGGAILTARRGSSTDSDVRIPCARLLRERRAGGPVLGVGEPHDDG
jgi:acyl-coenzyme A synthetase/AMP-(fatty) acid ligase